MNKILLFLAWIWLGFNAIAQQEVTFRIHMLNKGDGLLRVALYDSESSYEKEVTDMKYSFSKEDVFYGILEISMKVKPGKYAIAFLDDTNKDAKMNYNLIGIPKEGYAFSKIKDYGYSKPSFQETCIEIVEGQNELFKVYFNYF